FPSKQFWLTSAAISSWLDIRESPSESRRRASPPGAKKSSHRSLGPCIVLLRRIAMPWWPKPPWNCSTMGRPLRCRLGGSKNSGICWRHYCDRSEKAQYHPSRTATRVDRDRGGPDPLAGSTHDRPRAPRLCRLRGERGPAFPAALPRSAGTRKRPKPTSRCEEVTAHDRGDLASTYQSLPWQRIADKAREFPQNSDETRKPTEDFKGHAKQL